MSEDVARGLEATLHAALADPDIARSVEAGRLSGALSHTGFGASASAGSAASGSKPAPAATPRSPADRHAAGRKQIEAELALAWATAHDAAEARDIAAAAAAQAATSYDEAQARVRGLQARLDSVTRHG